MLKYKNGDLIGNLKVLEYTYKDAKYRVQCETCKNDPELYGEAVYEVTSDYLLIGKKPCGCSKSPKRSEEQWKVILNRKAIENGYEFVGFIGDTYTNQDTKLIVKCNSCNNIWNTCSASNFYRNRSCPICAKNVSAMKRTKDDSVWISKFMNSNQFDSNKFKFTRLTTRSWNVFCNICNDYFTSDAANLVAGKVPCNCGTGGGYDKSKTGYFYLLKCKQGNKEFIKYGITNFLQRRFVSHKRTTKESEVEILEQIAYEGDGAVVLQLESHLKRTLPYVKDCCFKRETCTMNNFTYIINQIEDLGFTEII